MSEDKEADAYLEEIKFAFHEWKHHKITRILFKYFRKTSEELTTLLLSNAFTERSDDIRLMYYYQSAAKLQILTELLHLQNIDDLDQMVGETIIKEGANDL